MSFLFTLSNTITLISVSPGANYLPESEEENLLNGLTKGFFLFLFFCFLIGFFSYFFVVQKSMFLIEIKRLKFREIKNSITCLIYINPEDFTVPVKERELIYFCLLQTERVIAFK